MKQIPDDALRQHVAIVGKTGSGKTYAAKGLVERLLGEGRRVCVLDPTGAWWGLRTSADGSGPGFPVMIFGGEHADVPVSANAGEAIGRLVAEQNVPAVIDLSETYLSERQRFVEHFAEAVYRLNKQPLHLVIDEADEFAPQNPLPDTKRMLGAIDRIVRRGRIRGFRVLMISQRPAVIHKNVLTQANTLIAMRLTSPQDRKAVEEWIRGQADAEEGKRVLASLARLQRGEGWVWAPEHDILQRTAFPAIATYDSSRTPDDEHPGLTMPTTIADVDVSEVRKALEQAIAEAEANDPAKLRRRIAELERQASGTRPPEPVDLGPVVARAKAEAAAGYRPLVEAMLARARELQGGIDTLAAELHSAATLLAGAQRVDHVADVRKLVNGTTGESGASRRQRPGAAPVGLDGSGRPPPSDDACSATRAQLTGPQQRVLDALAMWASIGVDAPSRAQVGFVAGIKPQGGHFNNTVGPLKTAGLIEYPSPGSIELSVQGREVAVWPEVTPDLESYQRGILELLKTGPQRKVVEALIRGGPGRTWTREQLGVAVGIDANGGHFNNTVGPLKTLGLISYPAKGTIQATELLFPRAMLELQGGRR